MWKSVISEYLSDPTMEFSSTTKVEYNCRNCNTICSKQSYSFYLQTKDRLSKFDVRVAWCSKCYFSSPEFTSKISAGATKSNKKLKETKTKFSEWQIIIQPFCLSLTIDTPYAISIEYLCPCGNKSSTLPKRIVKSIRNTGTIKCKSCTANITVNNPEYKRKQGIEISARFKDSAYMEKHINANKEKWKNENFAKAVTTWNVDHAKDRIIESEERWKNPTYREKMVNYMNLEETKIFRSELAKRILVPVASKAGCVSYQARKPLILEAKRKYIKERLDKEKFSVLDVSPSRVTIQCKLCDRIYSRKVDRLPRSCYCSSHPCTTQNVVADVVAKWGPKSVWVKGFNKFKDKVTRELDIAMNNGYAIEYCGLIWHSERYNKDKWYHYDKMKIAEQNGYKLITMFEDEWTNRRPQVTSYLLSTFDKVDKTIDRKCTVMEVDSEEATEFILAFHIQPIKKGSIYKAIGVYYENELISCITIGTHHRDSNQFVLNRLCSKPMTSVIGGLSKVLAFVRENYKEIKVLKTWSDNRWSTGDVYIKAGFQLTGELDPDYSYCRRGQRCSKQSLKKKLGEVGTERELRAAEGYSRIWDCGKKTWVYNF